MPHLDAGRPGHSPRHRPHPPVPARLPDPISTAPTGAVLTDTTGPDTALTAWCDTAECATTHRWSAPWALGASEDVDSMHRSLIVRVTQYRPEPAPAARDGHPYID